jgi:hypothetical protein
MQSTSGIKALALIAAALALSGCGGTPDPVWAQAFGVKCANAVGAPDFVCRTGPAEETEDGASRYCYATLGEPNCFDRPDPDRNQKPLGSTGY